MCMYSKYFYFLPWLIKSWKFWSYEKGRNHDYRITNFMRNSLNWDNQFREIYEESNYIVYDQFFSLRNMYLSIWQFYFLLCLKLELVSTWPTTLTKNFRIILRTYSKMSQIENTNLFFSYVIILYLDQYLVGNRVIALKYTSYLVDINK